MPQCVATGVVLPQTPLMAWLCVLPASAAHPWALRPKDREQQTAHQIQEVLQALPSRPSSSAVAAVVRVRVSPGMQCRANRGDVQPTMAIPQPG